MPFACFLSQEEPKRVSKALSDPAWVEAMQKNSYSSRHAKYSRGQIEQTLFFKKSTRAYIMLVQIYEMMFYGRTHLLLKHVQYTKKERHIYCQDKYIHGNPPEEVQHTDVKSASHSPQIWKSPWLKMHIDVDEG
ncbi:hypothetical protein Tco_0703644 [Tanacetum coccineum]|uniref:Uncharacterized protein n=1 Tax=Tanacetum coccineum TaxID=301880 RepID=A0ABQ4Y1B8_9ASTR